MDTAKKLILEENPAAGLEKLRTGHGENRAPSRLELVGIIAVRQSAGIDSEKFGRKRSKTGVAEPPRVARRAPLVHKERTPRQSELRDRCHQVDSAGVVRNAFDICMHYDAFASVQLSLSLNVA